MTSKEAAEVRKTAAAKPAATAKPEEKKEETENKLGTVPVPKVEVLPDNPTQVSSVVGGAAGQNVGLPRPVTQKDLDDQKQREAAREAGPATKDKK